VGPLGGGIAGLCGALIAGRLLMSVAYPLLVAQLLEQAWQTQVVGALRPALATALLFAVALSAAPACAARDWGELVAAAGLTFLVSTAAAFWIGLPRATRAALGRRLAAVIRLVR
jgi:hypothetical protein